MRVRSKLGFLPKMFVLLSGGASIPAMLTPRGVHSFMLGAPFQQARAACAAAVGVVELARARWHTGFIGVTSKDFLPHPARARLNEIISLQAAFCVIKKTKQPMLPVKTASMFCFLTCLMGVSILNRM